MLNLILFDDDNWQGLLPLTYTKPICELRVGILNIREKWEKYLGTKASFITQDFLAEKYPLHIEDDNIIINSTILPSEELLKLIKELQVGEAILADDELLAARLSKKQMAALSEENTENNLSGKDVSEIEGLFHQIIRPYDLFRYNGEEIKKDFHLLTLQSDSMEISPSNQVAHPENIYIEEGARIEFSILNAAEGPIYIGKNAKVMEGSILRGPVAICEHATVKMGAKIYGNTTIGPHCKAGGEINTSILSAYSSKGHDGFLGNSVLGEWCNIGADSNNSNLKNNYDEVKLWSYSSERFEKTGLQFCGLIMGDHSKCGINTMFNTGTVVGVYCNIYGSGYPRNYVPSYAWGGSSGFKTYQLKKALETAERVMIRRGRSMTPEDEKILKHIFYSTAQFRVWEKE